MKPAPATSDARERILETADRLFYQYGFRAIGIDRIIAEATVAKMSLYKHFASKDDLILAVLKYREEKVLEFFQSRLLQHEKRTKDRLRAFFMVLKDWFESPEFRGCAFQNAFIELADANHPGAQFVRDHKQRFQTFLTGLIDGSISKETVKVGPVIGLLVEGAIITAGIQGSSDSLSVARDASLRLVADAKRA